MEGKTTVEDKLKLAVVVIEDCLSKMYDNEICELSQMISSVEQEGSSAVAETLRYKEEDAFSFNILCGFYNGDEKYIMERDFKPCLSSLISSEYMPDEVSGIFYYLLGTSPGEDAYFGGSFLEEMYFMQDGQNIEKKECKAFKKLLKERVKEFVNREKAEIEKKKSEKPSAETKKNGCSIM